MRPIKRIAITGAAGQVAYSLLFMLAGSDLYGKDDQIALHLIDLPETQSVLEGIKLELEDCAFPLLREIRFGSDFSSLIKDCDLVIFLGAKPRSPGMERCDLLTENGKVFFEQAQLLNDVVHREAKILVVGNPCNTNCLILLHNAPKLSKRNFFALTYLDQNRAAAQIAKRAQIRTDAITHLVVWGNHSPTQVIDASHLPIKDQQKLSFDWLENDLQKVVRSRGSEIIKLRGKSSAASAAKAVMDALLSIEKPTIGDRFYSMAVYSENNGYGIDPDLFFSFPCRTTSEKQVEIVRNFSLSPSLREKLSITQKELQEERACVVEWLKGR